MDQEEKNTILLMQGKDGSVVKTKITQSQRDRIFFNEGGVKRDQVHMFLPEPVWEKLFNEEGCLLYEGFTLNHKAFGAGRAFFKDGTVCLEGVFGIKGLLCGRAYYPNGIIRFEGLFRLNRAYGPNFPEYGVWYDMNGKRLYSGKFRASRSSLGWPTIKEPEGFGFVPDSLYLGKKKFMWDDARRLMKEKHPNETDT